MKVVLKDAAYTGYYGGKGENRYHCSTDMIVTVLMDAVVYDVVLSESKVEIHPTPPDGEWILVPLRLEEA